MVKGREYELDALSEIGQGVAVVAHPLGCASGQTVEDLHLADDIQFGILGSRDEQGRPGQVDLVFRHAAQLVELFQNVFSFHSVESNPPSHGDIRVGR